MPELTNAQFAQGLRELAEIYESDERMALPDGWELGLYVSGAAPFRGTAMALSAGGRVGKLPPRDRDEYYYRIRRVLPSGLAIQISTPRSEVCKRVERMQLVTTWECPDSLLDPEAA